jgi:hypothetical protein
LILILSRCGVRAVPQAHFGISQQRQSFLARGVAEIQFQRSVVAIDIEACDARVLHDLLSLPQCRRAGALS